MYRSGGYSRGRKKKEFTHRDPEAHPRGGLKADFSETFRPTGNGGEGAEPPLTIILINCRLPVRRPLGSLTLAAL